jgi:crotonobetainyl-CoA:carnitine CoA-transferase CaiB-like acyl-CoA transferase
MSAAFSGITVVEFGPGAAVAYAGKLFAEMGATVVKVEPPSGDPLRRHMAFHDDGNGSQENGWFACLNAGKQSLVIDTGSAGGLAMLRRLFAAGSVLIHSAREQALSVSGLTPEQIAVDYPKLVVTAVTPYGLTGDWRELPADDLALQAIGGISLGIGEPGRTPLKLPGDQSAYQAGLSAAVAAAGQLFSGEGGLIDVAAADVWASFYNGGEIANDYFGRKKKPRAGYRVSRQPYVKAIFPCKDGFFAIQCLESRQWTVFLRMIGREDFLTHPLFANRAKATEEQADECNALLEPWFRENTKNEILQLCLKHKIPGAPVYDMREVLEHAHLRERGYFAELDTSKGKLLAPTHPYSGLGWDAAHPRRVPDINEHRPDILDVPDQSRTAFRDAQSARPLAGLRVIDFGWVWAGAIPGHVLADMGAEVIRIESRSPLDYMRQGRPLFGDAKDPEQNPVFQNVNRGKQSLCINLQEPGAADVMKALISKSDVVIENFSPGVMSKLGLGWKDLAAVRPDLIMCSMSAAGHKGPLQDIRTYAVMIGALSGLNSMVGYPDERVIAVQSPPYADPNAGIHATFGILAALWRRRQTGEGVHIDLSQWEAAVNLMGEQVMDYVTQRRVPTTCGNQQQPHAPYNHYPVIGEDKWISISIADDVRWQALAEVLGNPAWMKKPEFSTSAQRLENHHALDVLLAQETVSFDGDVLAVELQKKNIAAARLLDISDMAKHPYYESRALFEMVEHPILKAVPVYRVPWHLNGRPVPVTRRAPYIGEHTDQVLTNLLQKSPAEIADLRARRIID